MLDFALLAFFLGLKHSFDADHVLAVANVLPRAASIRHAFRLGLLWAVGHLVTALAITFLLFVFKDSGFLQPVLSRFELLVGVMLVTLGCFSIFQSGLFHMHKHKHDSAGHTHVHSRGHHDGRRMLGIGFLQGLASNDELLVLVTATLGVSTFGMAAFGIAVFTLGVVAGMAAFSAMIAFPLVKSNQGVVLRAFYLVAGMASVAYGLVILLQNL